MSFIRKIHRTAPTWLRRFPAILLLLALPGLLAGLIQPAAARPQKAVLPMRVRINEVAWAGTRANDFHEWIELYNPGNAPIDLTGWKLRVRAGLSGTPDGTIDLVNMIPAGGYFLLERYQNATSLTADYVYPDSIGLDKAGMVLELVDGASTLQDTANANGGLWPAGSAQPDYCSMERVPGQQDADGAWRSNDNITRNGTDFNQNTICGTPGNSNSTLPFTATPTITATLPPTSTGTPTSTPTNIPSAYPQVFINEVAWMGTRANYSSEWIELYNPGTKPVNLARWKLNSEKGPLVIDLTGTIPAGGYYLLERNDDTPISDIKADQIYLGSMLSDFGESLQLINPEGGLSSTANRQNNFWPAGNAFSYCTMERAGKAGKPLADFPANWITNVGLVTFGRDLANNKICGTPRHENWAYSVTPTASYTPTPITPTRTPYPPYYTPTRTRTPKRSPTPTINPNAPKAVSIVINEFLAQPRTDWNGDSKIDSGDEYIEIINLGVETVSLSGWTLDDQQGDSTPHSLGSISIAPKARLAFFSSTTGLLLSNGGDSVRLFKSNGQLTDVFTYAVNPNADQTWCRLPDGGRTWVFGCAPTVLSANRMAQSAIVGNRVESAICLSKTMPLGIIMAECDSVGLAAWDAGLWQAVPAYPLYMDAGPDIYILD